MKPTRNLPPLWWLNPWAAARRLSVTLDHVRSERDFALADLTQANEEIAEHREQEARRRDGIARLNQVLKNGGTLIHGSMGVPYAEPKARTVWKFGKSKPKPKRRR